MNLSTTKALALAAVLVIPSISHANLLNVLDHGDYFSDLNSGLDWLDVTKSANLSYDYVSTQFGNGGEFEGWRYATASEFGAMWDGITGLSFGIQTVDQSSQSGPSNSYAEVIGLFGDTLNLWWNEVFGTTYCEDESPDDENCFAAFTYGIIADTATDGDKAVAGIELFIETSEPDNKYITTKHSTPSDSANYEIGSFLVRDSISVPTPPVVILLAVGFAGFGVSRYTSLANKID